MNILKTFDSNSIMSIIPHRHENILVDTVSMGEIEGVQAGQLEVCIDAEDLLGRELFFKQKKQGKYVLMSPIFLEVMALGAVVCSDRATPELPVFFTSISSYKKVADFYLGTRLLGVVKKVRDKAGFLICSGVMTCEGHTVCQSTISAFFPTKEQLAVEPDKVAKKTKDISFERSLLFPIQKTALKHPHMYMCDALIQVDLDQKQVVGTYVFPHNHPLVKGHFPNNPILMGVLQCTAVEDVMTALGQFLSHRDHITGIYDITCHVSLIHEQGHVVCDMKGVVLRLWIGQADMIDQAEMVSVDKVTFRDSVRPNEQVTIICQDVDMIACP